MNTRYALLAGALTLTLASSAFAQANKPNAKPSSTNPVKVETFKDIDKNGDGYIERTEANAATGLSSMFSDLDTNKDGKLSSAEYAKRDHK